ncbi:UNVERIFIED_CONTAM: hypothetical protein Sradi_0387400 [Sesamum radiatum]|uniref:Uncharacterized protein n=1 Tax=Sesamum radiatum TaxID=300843 RepID=A0AAW2W548_SESRA
MILYLHRFLVIIAIANLTVLINMIQLSDMSIRFNITKSCTNHLESSVVSFTCLLGINSFKVEKFLKKIGLGKEDHHFWKQVGKALLCTYALFGVAWLWNETSPLGWWTLKPKPKEEKELAHLYERRKFPYPGDKEAMEEFVAKGG